MASQQPQQPQQPPQPPPPAASSGASKVWWALGGLAVLAAVVLLAWLIFGGDDSEDTSGKVGPKIVDQQQLVDFQKDLGHTIYWVGPQPGLRFELTKLNNGNVYIRYLPEGAQAGDARPAFLSVSTYPVPDAFNKMLQLSKKSGSVSKRVQGGIAVSPGNRRQSVYIAYPGSPYQIEVYDPSAREARKVAFSGQVRPVN